MESRNVKVIDEHSIDRDAYVICGINLDGSDYVLYSIERDGDNDNLFVSKIIKNIDGTSNMVNIEDSMEKNKVNEVAKELITYSIKNEADKTTDTVTLADGKAVKISGVLFNKEQNINVGKTYITTVKKSVSKVSEDFYKVDAPKVEESNSIFETMSANIEVPKAEEAMPSLEELKVEEPAPTPVVAEVPELPKVEPVVPEVVPTVEPAVPTPVEPELPKAVEPEKVEVAAVEPVIPVVSPVPGPVSVEPVESKPAEPVVPVAPIPAVVPPVPAPEPEKVEEVKPVSSEPELKLFFDGSKETNLNQALGEVSDDKTLPTASEGVQSLREFGVDEPVTPVVSAPVETPAVAPVVVPEVAAPVSETGKVLTKSKGFANNKFFMVIAIVFFIASCVFLGYEAFRYFQLAK